MRLAFIGNLAAAIALSGCGSSAPLVATLPSPSAPVTPAIGTGPTQPPVPPLTANAIRDVQIAQTFASINNGMSLSESQIAHTTGSVPLIGLDSARSAARADKMVTVDDTTPGDGVVDISIDGVSYRAVAQVDGQGHVFYSALDGTTLVELLPVDNLSDVTLSGLTQTDETTKLSVFGFVANGQLTPQAALDLRAADAGLGAVGDYSSGQAYVVATRGDGQIDTAKGTFSALVFFDSGTIDGNLDLVSPNTPVDPSAYDLKDLSIQFSGAIGPGNQFTSSPQLSNPANAGIAVGTEAGTVEGKFFGAGAENIGGTFIITGQEVTAPGFVPLDITIDGGFVGTQ